MEDFCNAIEAPIENPDANWARIAAGFFQSARSGRWHRRCQAQSSITPTSFPHNGACRVTPSLGRSCAFSSSPFALAGISLCAAIQHLLTHRQVHYARMSSSGRPLLARKAPGSPPDSSSLNQDQQSQGKAKRVLIESACAACRRRKSKVIARILKHRHTNTNQHHSVMASGNQ